MQFLKILFHQCNQKMLIVKRNTRQETQLEKLIAAGVAKALPTLIAALKENAKNTNQSEGSATSSPSSRSRIETTYYTENSGNSRNHELKNKERGKDCKYKTFKSCKPSTFNGEKGATETIKWLEEIEGEMEISDCVEEDKVRFAATYPDQTLFGFILVENNLADSSCQAPGSRVAYHMTVKTVGGRSQTVRGDGHPMICMNAISSKKGRWTLLRQDSKFADCRRVRMQKTSKEIPAGTVAVVLAAHGERVECRQEGGQSKRNSTCTFKVQCCSFSSQLQDLT
ncbi:hypothetical protein L1987_77907 [Smallanthus sonchifolius]|uniref:Uncharacterized protein n=1 Tax=Smallanthus sonchifolius TaxID=185202 RepID=A0ACB8ZC75_9ASTR|nr:hypothetical protein L1987_77907 [Smallanthus sonchifolius]